MDEQQKLFLERQWALLDGNKSLRSHIPTVCCTLIIGVSAFYFHSDNFGDLSNAWLLFVAFDIFICIAGQALRIVHEQYDYSNNKVETLYEKFKMTYIKKEDKYEQGSELFKVGYMSIIVFAVAAAIAKICIG